LVYQESKEQFKTTVKEDRSTGKVSFAVYKNYAKEAGGYLVASMILVLYGSSQVLIHL